MDKTEEGGVDGHMEVDPQTACSGPLPSPNPRSKEASRAMCPRIAFLSRMVSSSSSSSSSRAEGGEEGSWGWMLPEILADIVRRLEEGDAEKWPARRAVVAFACTCRSWREVAKGVVGAPGECGRITFPSALKQPGPRDKTFQCFIRRDTRNATYYLYLGLSKVSVDSGKFLLAARRLRRGAHIEYVISLDADDLSQGSNAYMGKLRSDFLGINFKLYDSQPPFEGAKVVHSRSTRRFTSKQISPQVPAGNFDIGIISYKFNLLRSRGPRRILCDLQSPATKKTASGESVKEPKPEDIAPLGGQMMLKNKAPRWHEHLQCWCLNFHGRVTIASVKNFQLVVKGDPSQAGDEETVVLQFGKVDEDTFTMDYRDPLSAFQAFAICLTSFGTKLACE